MISQAIAPNVGLREGSTIPVVVSRGVIPVPVPDLSKLSVADATQRLIGAGLQLGQQSQRFDASAMGTVLSWSGQGGTLPKGSAVDLVVSQGPPTVAVPSVAGKSWASAQADLVAANLTAVQDLEFSDTVGKGLVVGTKPAGGTTARVGSQVTVVVSKGLDLVAVPSVQHATVDAATATLQAAGFAVTGVTGNPTRNVTRTSPAAGSQVKRGSAVTLFTT